VPFNARPAKIFFVFLPVPFLFSPGEKICFPFVVDYYFHIEKIYHINGKMQRFGNSRCRTVSLFEEDFRRTRQEGCSVRIKSFSGILAAAAVCSVLCALLSTVAVVAVQIAFSRFGPNNPLELSQDPFYALSGWAFLLYDLLHIFVIAVFAFVLARAFRWEAWMGGAASVVSSLADFASLSVNIFFLTTALRVLAQGRAIGFANPEAGYEVICSMLDFAQASFGLVGTLFLAAAAIKVSGIARVAGWFLVAGLPASFFQVAEVRLHTTWTALVDDWVTPIDEIVLHIVIGIALFDIIRHRVRPQVPPSTQAPITRPASLQDAACKSCSKDWRIQNSEADTVMNR